MFCSTAPAVTIALGATAVSTVDATVFHVDPEEGKSDNDGSVGRPRKTIEEVLTRNLIQTRSPNGRVKNKRTPVKAGDTLLLRSGYHGEIYCRGAYNDDYITMSSWMIPAPTSGTPRTLICTIRRAARRLTPAWTRWHPRSTLTACADHKGQASMSGRMSMRLPRRWRGEESPCDC